jgi:glycosyltransferase involved in cell wall biosynthesis
MKPLITALVDTYNHERYIEQALVSVLEQELSPAELEIVVVDDGSTDRTPEIIQKFAPRVKHVRKTNGGQASAFNAGFAEARGEIVAFLDGDDYWLPGKLRRVMDELERHPEAGLVYHSFREVKSEGRESRAGGFSIVSGFLPANRKDLLSYDLHPTSTLSFRRSFLQKLLPVPEELVIQADGYLSACIIFLAPVVGIPEALTAYRIHGSNLWHVEDGKEDPRRLQRRIATTKALGERVESWLARNGYDVTRPELRAFCLRWTLCYRADEFRLWPPNRLTFFRFLLNYPRFYGMRMSWRHKTVFYINAFGSLLVGYRRYHLLDEWRLKAKQALRGL